MVARYKVTGLDCAEEAAALERSVGPLVGGKERLSFDYLEGVMTVEGEVSPQAIIAAVARIGMKAQSISERPGPGELPLHDDRRERNLFTLLSAVLTAAGFASHVWLAGGVVQAIGREGLGPTRAVPILSMVLYGLAVAFGVRFVLPKAWLSARHLRPDMNLLMMVAIAGAIVLGEWLEAASVAMLFALSLTLEAWSVARARRAVAALLDLTPNLARVKGPTGEQDIPVERVEIATVIVVRPGERIPLDGTVVAGRSDVNQAPITGESVPVAKNPGAEVFAGTVNGHGVLELRTTRRAGDTTLAHIIRLVRDARAKRGVAEQWVERFARRYTPTVMVLAIVVAVAPPLLALGPWSAWIYRALVLLVIACPCALVISTPVAVVAGLAAAAREGVLIKGGLFLEAPARLRAIALDKTGTLTEGRLAVETLVPLDGHTDLELVSRAAALESRSTHPLARAILAHARKLGVEPQPAEDVVMIAGLGATGRVAGREFWVGSRVYLQKHHQETPEVHELLERLAAQGGSVVVVGNERHVCGAIVLSDRVREESRASLGQLRELGVQELVMLTGDNLATARAVGERAGVTDVRAELLPEAKVAAIQSLVQRTGATAMVGDGVNDAPAMAAATLGIAMGAAGSDAAIETADIALMSDDLSKLPWLVRHSRRAVRVIRQNIGFALVVKAVFIALAFAGRATLWGAIAADMGASLLVIFNALRLLDSKGSRSRAAATTT